MGINIDQQFFDTFEAAFQEGDTNLASKSEEASNVRQVQQIYRILAQGDFSALGELLADDVVFEIIGSSDNPFAGYAQGRQQVIDAARHNFTQLEEQRPEIEAVVAQGDTVVVMARERGRYVPTGQEYDFHWVHLYRFKEGKLKGIRELADTGAITKGEDKLGQ
jgi:ketosteroid isomerase-like protein